MQAGRPESSGEFATMTRKLLILWLTGLTGLALAQAKTYANSQYKAGDLEKAH